MDVDDVIERRVAVRFFPYLARHHLARYHVSAAAHEVFQEDRIPARSIPGDGRAGRHARPRHVQFQVADAEPLVSIGSPAAAERANTGENSGKANGLTR